MTLSGPRPGHPNVLRKLLARAQARSLSAFVVPGMELAHAHSLDLRAAGLAVVATPRHASVLVLIGEIPAGLAASAAVAYAQMPRPRALLAVGTGTVSSLPAPDVTVPAEHLALTSGVSALRRRFVESGFAVADQGAMQPAAGAMAMDHTTHSAEHASMDHDAQGPVDHAMMEHGAHGMGHEQMGHGHHGSMLMVPLTRLLPRSVDGLPMEWLEAPFGPLFPGLPGGLGLTLTLDGDTVAEARVQLGALTRNLEAQWRGPVEGFSERFARLDPLSPAAYGALVQRAVEAAGSLTDGRTRVKALERERAASHLGWLAKFALLLGDRELEDKAIALRLRLSRARDASALRQLQQQAHALRRWVDRSPLSTRRLRGVGVVGQGIAAELGGPVARAAGQARDARMDDPAYRELGFHPLAVDGGDALARLRLRLAELEQSLDLLLTGSAEGVVPLATSTHQATIETPRGAATLRIQVDSGQVTHAELWSPSQRLAELIGPVAEGRELADALLGIASLDISPWELDR